MYYVVGFLKKKVTGQQVAYNLFWVFIWNALGCVSSCYVCLSDTHTHPFMPFLQRFPPFPSPSSSLHPHHPIPSSPPLSPSPPFIPLPPSLPPSHLSSLFHCRSTTSLHPLLTKRLIHSSYCTRSYLTQIFADDQQRQFVIAAAEAKGRMSWSQALMRSIPANILICTSIQMGIAVSALTEKHRKGKREEGEGRGRVRLS
jgi:hypothetical protein